MDVHRQAFFKGDYKKLSIALDFCVILKTWCYFVDLKFYSLFLLFFFFLKLVNNFFCLFFFLAYGSWTDIRIVEKSTVLKIIYVKLLQRGGEKPSHP